jgi:DNA-directed RNA polymerase specialized sigma24 family protein
MSVHPPTETDLADFTAFVSAHEPTLLQALVATYGVVDGREATVDALSWAWEHWDRLVDVENKRGYLYRVGQSATRRYSARPIPPTFSVPDAHHLPDIDPGLVPALQRLSEQQRTIVVLVHAFGWTQTEVAQLLEVTPSTVREHLRRAIERLREELGVCGVD